MALDRALVYWIEEPLEHYESAMKQLSATKKLESRNRVRFPLPLHLHPLLSITPGASGLCLSQYRSDPFICAPVCGRGPWKTDQGWVIRPGKK